MDVVAKEADVSKGVVNYYFAGKRDLLLQSFHASLESYKQLSHRPLRSRHEEHKGGNHVPTIRYYHRCRLRGLIRRDGKAFRTLSEEA